MQLYHSDRYLYELPKGHRFPIEKYGLLRDQLVHEGIARPDSFQERGLCEESLLLKVHAPSYWERLRSFSLDEKEKRRLGLPLNPTSLNRALNSVSATVSAAGDALEEGVAFNLGGGTHHAFRDRGEAFSIFNDLAVAARYHLEEGNVERILILDLDVHQGNGTASIFSDEPRVFSFSMHGAKNYPFRKERSDRDVELPTGTDDAQYLECLEQELRTLFDLARPDLILYQAGVDVLESDRLGRLALSKSGCRERDRQVFTASAQRGVPVAVTLGGGYSERVADVVDAHANTVREGIKLQFQL